MIRQKFDVGDLVEVRLPYGESQTTIGFVTKTRVINAHMNLPEKYKWHPDEYTCLIQILGSNDSAWVRAKHLKTLKRAKGPA